MASVWSELKRRNVVKVAVAYAVVAWLLIEITSTVFPLLQLPDWTATFVAALLIVGFPVALVFAWAFELTPEGIKREKDVDRAESITHRTGQKLNYGITALLVLAVGFILVDNFVLDGEAPQSDSISKSIAVLPFQNLSPDPNNAYFAAGIHESILNQLSKLRDLSVIARTSVLRYEIDPPPVPEIAEALKVEIVMEGSVRFADDRVLITAQLIDGQSGTHIWSEEYDSDLADIFAVQTEIAERIATALEAELTPDERETLAKAPTDNPDAYRLYLQSFAYDLPNAVAHQYLDEAIRLDPNFATAYANQAILYASELNSPNVADEELPELEALVRQYADKALALDPTLGLAYAAIGRMHQGFWRATDARLAYEKALELAPNDPEVLAIYTRFLIRMGEAADTITLAQRALQLDPNNFDAHNRLGVAYLIIKDPDSAAAAYRKAIEIDPVFFGAHTLLGYAEAMRGNDSEALAEFRLADQIGGDSPGALARTAYGYGLIGRTEDALRLLQKLEALAVAGDRVGPGRLGLAYLGAGDYEQALDWFKTAADTHDPTGGFLIEMLVRENVMSDPILEQPEWVSVRSKLGLGR